MPMSQAIMWETHVPSAGHGWPSGAWGS
jgi:hypothetical protein